MNRKWTLWLVVPLIYLLWAGFPTRGQQQPNPADPAERLDRIEKRLAEVEVQLGQLIRARTTGASSRAGSRIDRLEQRVTRLESGASPLRYRPGSSSSGFSPGLESRLRALEREVARLQR